MHRLFQLVVVIALALILVGPLSTSLNPATETLAENTMTLYYGDEISFSTIETPVTLEAMNDEDTFTFIGDDQVFKGEVFATGHKATFNPGSELRLVEGEAKIRLISESEFTYTYTPGAETKKLVFFAFFVIWAILSIVICILIEAFASL